MITNVMIADVVIPMIMNEKYGTSGARNVMPTMIEIDTNATKVIGARVFTIRSRAR
jgi:hypothetical protein